MTGIADALEPFVDAGEVAGLVALVARGDDAEVTVLGDQAIGGSPMQEDSMFRVASAGKPVTAAAALALVADGRLTLDQPVDDLLPELAQRRVLRAPSAALDDTVPAVRSVTVRDLLRSTSGLGFSSDFTAPISAALFERLNQGPPRPQDFAPPDEWIARVGELPFIHQPGEGSPTTLAPEQSAGLFWYISERSGVTGPPHRRSERAPERAIYVRVVDGVAARDVPWVRFVMDGDRVHRVFSDDGTEIAGRVRGHGPPLVMVHGGLGDGNPDTTFMLPFLAEHFTCYLLSTRGRGVSAEHPDHSRERQYEDVAAFVEGIGERVSVFGHSSGAVWVLGGAARAAGACHAIALYEPALPVTRPVMSDDAYARYCAAVTEGRVTDAFWIGADEIIMPTDEERALLSIPGVIELSAPLLPVTVREIREVNRPTDTASLEILTMPVLLLGGTRSADQYKDTLRSLNEALDQARVVNVSGAGHLGPMTHPEAVAQELVSFFKS